MRLAALLNCREAARRLSQAQDRRLSMWDRIRLYLHLRACDACTRYARQLAFIRKALRRYAG
jgi:hypothetical protein